MKKIAWGMAVYMLSGPAITLLVLGVSMLPWVLGSYEVWYYGLILVPGLLSAGGFYLLMRGAEDLGSSGNLDWVRKISMVLAAYGLAETLLSTLELMPDLGIISTILAYAYYLGGFFAVYLTSISMIELQLFRRVNLYAREIQKWFSIWVITRFVGSLIPALSGLASLAELAAAVVMVVYFFRAAKNFDDSRGNFRVL